MKNKTELIPQDFFGNDFNTFAERDPFNQPNFVEGYISRKPNEYYGALIITRVNHEQVTPQLIMGSPKIPYPFSLKEDGTKNYTFPSSKKIEAYEKLDGTNILAFVYQDSKGMVYVSYKTRLRPFVGESRFGNFLELWKEAAGDQFNTIRQIMLRKQCNLSFELYGNRNRHLIVYKVPLSYALLFGVTNTGRVLSPTDLGALSWREASVSYVEAWELPVVKLMETMDRNYVWRYETMREELEEGLTELEDNCYSGEEGAVWYMHTHDGRTLQFKCKPPTVEDIHRSAAEGIGKNVIIATCWNAYENTDDPTVEFIKQLLEEEFSADKVDSNHYRIEKYLEFVKAEMVFRNDVVELYRGLGQNIILEKADVMREMSKHFPKNQMRKVYSIISSFG